MRLLCLLSFTALSFGQPPPRVNGLSWHVSVQAVHSTFDAIQLRAFLSNVSGKDIRFEAKGERPPVELILTADGKKPVKKALPKQAHAYRTPGTLRNGQYAWNVICDIRHAFGRLAPGRYTLQIVHEARDYKVDVAGFKPRAIPSAKLRFAVVATTLKDAQLKAKKSKSIDFKVVTKGATQVGVLTNRGGTSLKLWAYGDQPGQPLNALLTPQTWTGRRWSGSLGGFCGTGLVEVIVKPGQSRDLRLPAFGDGILRFTVNCRTAANPNLMVASDPILVDRFK